MHDDHPRDECGIVGIRGNSEAATLTYLGMQALQHRGQESAGIVSCDGEKHYTHIGKGLVSEVFNEENLATLIGDTAIGHVRYSTTGSNRVVNAQPLRVDYKGGALAVAHNGNFTNATQLRSELEQRGAIFRTTNDSEILIHLIAQHYSSDFMQTLISSLQTLQGAYSLVLLHNEKLIAVRDPRGIRPLCIGTLPGGGHVAASESCAMDIMGAQYLRELKPGEMIIIDDDGIRSEKPFPETPHSYCVFEYIYISRPDSLCNGKTTIYDIRLKMGETLAREHPVKGDVVIPVPDSANAAAIGFGREAGIPFEHGLIRSHYIGRTFIEPEQSIRDFGARLKYNAARGVLANKRVVVVDDSIVRGTTSRKIVRLIRNAGAKEVHLRISAPIWQHPCFYGVDTPNKEELIGSAGSVEEIRRYTGADTLGFLSIENLLKSVPRTVRYCKACFDGNYTAGRPEDFRKTILERGKISTSA